MFLRNLTVINNDDDHNNVDYKLNFKVLNVVIDDDYRFNKDNVSFIYDEINGFQRVLMSNNKFAFYDVANAKFSDFTYDVVTDFNDLGYAMVARDGGVTWMDKSFNILDNTGALNRDNGNNINNNTAFTSVYNFSNGKYPLAKATVIGNEIFSCFINKDLEIQKFYDSFNDDSKKANKSIYKFDYVEPFYGDYNFTKDKSKVLLSNGHFVNFYKFIKCAEDFGVFDTLIKKADNVRIKK